MIYWAPRVKDSRLGIKVTEKDTGHSQGVKNIPRASKKPKG